MTPINTGRRMFLEAAGLGLITPLLLSIRDPIALAKQQERVDEINKELAIERKYDKNSPEAEALREKLRKELNPETQVNRWFLDFAAIFGLAATITGKSLRIAGVIKRQPNN